MLKEAGDQEMSMGSDMAMGQWIPCWESLDIHYYHKVLHPEGQWRARESSNEVSPGLLPLSGSDEAVSSLVLWEWHQKRSDKIQDLNKTQSLFNIIFIMSRYQWKQSLIPSKMLTWIRKRQYKIQYWHDTNVRIIW